MIICKICFESFDNQMKLSSHLRFEHKIKSKDYYNKFHRKVYCPICGKETCFINKTKGYRKYCSTKCSAVSEEKKNSYKETCLKKYGVDNVSKNSDVKNKKMNTMIKNFGVNHHLKLNTQKDKQKNTCIIRYNVDNVSRCKEINDKRKQTFLNRIGVDNPFSLDKVKKDIKKYNLENYGVNFSTQRKDVREKIKKTNLERYGYPTPFQRKDVKEKIKKTNLERYGFENVSSCNDVKEKKRKLIINRFLPTMIKYLKELNLKLISKYSGAKNIFNIQCLKCGTIFQDNFSNIRQGCGRCPECFPKRQKSVKETEISNFIESLNFKVLRNDRNIINPYELDIVIPIKNIGVEYNGLYWHSEKFRKGKSYHLNKLNLCEDKNIRLIQIFEDEWIFKQEIVKKKLKQILDISNSKRIHARKCFIKEISFKTKNEFLEKYHMQGCDISNIKLGAFYCNELVAVMTFSKGNIAKGSKYIENVWELNRFCTDYKYRIPGVASKLLTYFKRNYEWKEVFSYADRRWSVGNLYYLLGFSLEKCTEPNYWYTKGFKRIHRFNLRKRAEEPKDVPEWLLRLNEGYSRIWDCGHLKFVLKS